MGEGGRNPTTGGLAEKNLVQKASRFILVRVGVGVETPSIKD
jgi:hypothetical protein